MKQVYRIDNQGFYLEPVLVENNTLPEDCVETSPPDGLYRPRYLDGAWIETLSEDEIEEISNREEPNRLDKLEATMLELADMILLLESRSAGQ